MTFIKKVTEQEWDSIHDAICQGENIPRVEANGYKVDKWLTKDACFDSVHGHYIPKDKVTEKYTTGFEEIELSKPNLDTI